MDLQWSFSRSIVTLVCAATGGSTPSGLTGSGVARRGIESQTTKRRDSLRAGYRVLRCESISKAPNLCRASHSDKSGQLYLTAGGYVEDEPFRQRRLAAAPEAAWICSAGGLLWSLVDFGHCSG